MTLTPAIREALDKLEWAYDNINSDREYFERNVLSVVAAEEGRKYEALVKLHREWAEARAQLLATEEQFVASETRREALARYQRAIDALAQWEARKALGGSK